MVALSAVSAKPSGAHKRTTDILYPRNPGVKSARHVGRKHARVVRRQVGTAGAPAPTDAATADDFLDPTDSDDYMDPEEAADEAQSQAYNQAILQNSCARNVPLGLDAGRMNDKCNQFKGTIISMTLPNKSAFPYMSSLNTGTASAQPFAASQTAKTYAPSKAMLYACMCTVSLVLSCLDLYGACGWRCRGSSHFLSLSTLMS